MNDPYATSIRYLENGGIARNMQCIANLYELSIFVGGEQRRMRRIANGAAVIGWRICYTRDNETVTLAQWGQVP